MTEYGQIIKTVGEARLYTGLYGRSVDRLPGRMQHSDRSIFMPSESLLALLNCADIGKQPPRVPAALPE